MMLSVVCRTSVCLSVCLSDVCRVHPVSGRRVRPAGWAGAYWLIGPGPARPAWHKDAAARFRCRPAAGAYRGGPPTACYIRFTE